MLSSPVLSGVLWSERHSCTFTEQHVPWGVPWGDGQWVTVCLHAGRCVSSTFSPSPWSSRPASPAAAHVPCIGRSGSPTPHPPPPPPPPPAGMCAATCTSRETCARGNSSPSRSSSLGSGKTGESTAPRAKTIPTVSHLIINNYTAFIQNHFSCGQTKTSRLRVCGNVITCTSPYLFRKCIHQGRHKKCTI